MLTNDELQAIRARCNYMVEACPSDRGMLERDRYCRDYAQKDIPALLSHIEAQRNALAKAEAAKAVLVEAINIMCRNALELGYCNEIDCTKCDFRAALARVKESPCPKN